MQSGGYRLIPLYNRHAEIVGSTKVDEADYEKLAAYRWHVGSNGYARTSHADGLPHVLLHRAVLDLGVGDGRMGDHINRDKLDNRRANLRIVSQNENAKNRGSNRGATSRFRGVQWEEARQLWRARPKYNNQSFHLGRFEHEEDAGEAVRQFWAERGF